MKIINGFDLLIPITFKLLDSFRNKNSVYTLRLPGAAPKLWDSKGKEQFFLSPEHVDMRPLLQPVLPVPHLSLRTRDHTLAKLTLFCGRGNLRFSSLVVGSPLFQIQDEHILKMFCLNNNRFTNKIGVHFHTLVNKNCK